MHVSTLGLQLWAGFSASEPMKHLPQAVHELSGYDGWHGNAQLVGSQAVPGVVFIRLVLVDNLRRQVLELFTGDAIVAGLAEQLGHDGGCQDVGLSGVARQRQEEVWFP